MKSLLFSLCLLCSSLGLLAQNQSLVEQRPFVEVSGQADTFIVPDEIYIHIILSEQDTKNKISVEEQEQKMIGAFKKMNINVEKNLVSNDMASNYKAYLLRLKKDILKTKEYTLKVNSAATASAVFLALEAVGISNTSIDKVEYSNIKALKFLCAVRAAENAKRKAQALTKALGQTLGKVLFVSDQNDRYTTERDYTYNAKNQGGRLKLASALSSFSTPPTIEFEKIKISSIVSVKFAIE